MPVTDAARCLAVDADLLAEGCRRCSPWRLDDDGWLRAEYRDRRRVLCGVSLLARVAA